MDRVQAAAEKNWQNVDNEVWNVREGCRKKMREKYGLLPNPPRTPTPRFGLFPENFFFLKNASLMAETNFTLGPISKIIKCPF